jgi:hypothetical protein
MNVHVNISVLFSSKHFWTGITFEFRWQMSLAVTVKSSWRFKRLGTFFAFEGFCPSVQVNVVMRQVAFIVDTVVTNDTFE